MGVIHTVDWSDAFFSSSQTFVQELLRSLDREAVVATWLSVPRGRVLDCGDERAANHRFGFGFGFLGVVRLAKAAITPSFAQKLREDRQTSSPQSKSWRTIRSTHTLADVKLWGRRFQVSLQRMARLLGL